jgi:hypothetical protein
MNSGYRDDLAAAQARIAELESTMDAPDLAAREREHAALVRSVPSRDRVRWVVGLAVFVSLIALTSMLFLSSPYDQHPRFAIAMQMLTIAGMSLSASMMWVSRVMGLRSVALSERLLAAERARVALEARVRVAEPARVESAEPLSSDAVEAPPTRRRPEPRR